MDKCLEGREKGRERIKERERMNRERMILQYKNDGNQSRIGTGAISGQIEKKE